METMCYWIPVSNIIGEDNHITSCNRIASFLDETCREDPDSGENGYTCVHCGGEVEVQQELTTPTHWDCECEHNYIHPKTITFCELCGTNQDSQPDSITTEVAKYLSNEFK